MFVYRNNTDACFSNEPIQIFIWAHGVTGYGNCEFSNYGQEEWLESDYGFTISSDSPYTSDYRLLNITSDYHKGPDYRWDTYQIIDAGNSYAIIPAQKVSDEVWKDAYYKIYPEREAADREAEMAAAEAEREKAEAARKALLEEKEKGFFESLFDSIINFFRSIWHSIFG